MHVAARPRLECIRGKRSFTVDADDVAARARRYEDVWIDLGTGDGRYALQVARTCPATFAIGLDACRDALRDGSRRAADAANLLLVVANALALPPGLSGLATRVTVNFPWGSLLAGLLDGEPALLEGLRAITLPGAVLECRLNGDALASAGLSLRAGGGHARRVLGSAGFVTDQLVELDARALRACPTTWAKRLAYGRDPRAVYLRARRQE